MYIIVPIFYSWIPRSHASLDAFSPLKRRNHYKTIRILRFVRYDLGGEKRNTVFPKCKKRTNVLVYHEKQRPPEKSEKTILQTTTPRPPKAGPTREPISWGAFANKKNKFRIGSVDIGLVNVAVAATRVVGVPSRHCTKACKKRRCL